MLISDISNVELPTEVSLASAIFFPSHIEAQPEAPTAGFRLPVHLKICLFNLKNKWAAYRDQMYMEHCRQLITTYSTLQAQSLSTVTVAQAVYQSTWMHVVMVDHFATNLVPAIKAQLFGQNPPVRVPASPSVAAADVAGNWSNSLVSIATAMGYVGNIWSWTLPLEICFRQGGSAASSRWYQCCLQSGTS